MFWGPNSTDCTECSPGFGACTTTEYPSVKPTFHLVADSAVTVARAPRRQAFTEANSPIVAGARLPIRVLLAVAGASLVALQPAITPAKTTPSSTLCNMYLGRSTPRNGSTSLAPLRKV
jgi:hypothetical protein